MTQEFNGFRNVLVHDYLGLDYEQVWVVIERELPALKFAIEALLAAQQD
jgi:uncharacterized protein with HEPN domain